MKKILLLITVGCFLGCANGTFHTGSTATDAALTAGTVGLAGQVASLASQVATGQNVDLKKALVQASGDALRSLEATGVTAVQPVVQEQISKWVPKTPMWQDFAHGLGKLMHNYAVEHGNTHAAINAGLEAAAITLNNF